jgi:hypothetical protein
MNVWTVECACQRGNRYTTCDREKAAEVATHHVIHCGESHVTAWVQLSLDEMLGGVK